MAVAKRQRKEKACKNGTKENPRTKVRTSGETNSPSGQPNLHKAGSGGGGKHMKRGAKIGPLLLGQPALMPWGVISFVCQVKLSCNRDVTLVHHFKSLLW